MLCQSMDATQEMLQALKELPEDYTNDEELVQRCVELGSTFGIDASTLVTRWETYQLKNAIGKEKRMTLMALDRFEKYLRTQQTQTQKKKGVDTSNRAPIINGGLGESFMDAFKIKQEPSYETPIRGGRHHVTDKTPESSRISSMTGRFGTADSSPISPTMLGQSSQTYATRTNRGNSEASFNKKMSEHHHQPAYRPGNVVLGEIGIYENAQTQPYKYMFQKMSTKSDVLDERVDESARRLVKKHFKDSELSHLGIATQETVRVVGIVCCDSDGRLNDQSTMLEGSRYTSNGARVHLDLSEMSSFSLFPGQIIAAEGTNTTGESVIASKIFQSSALPFQKTNVNEVSRMYYDTPGMDCPLSILVCSGPFSTLEDLLYEPLHDFLQLVKEKQPDVLILMGPFLDSNNKLVESCTVDAPFNQLFESRLTDTLNEILDATHSQIIVIPSLRDVNHDFVFPQPPYPLTGLLRSFEGEPRVKFYPNPSTILINEVVFGICTSDIMMNLSAQEIARNPVSEKPDRLGRIVNHLIDQRSYYPLFPPAQGINIDFEHFSALQFPITPDILILPSDLTVFAKDVHRVLCINPGRLTKGRSGGTYAQLTLAQPRQIDIPSSGTVTANVLKRCKVDVFRI